MYHFNLLSGLCGVIGLLLLFIVGPKLKRKMNKDAQELKHWEAEQNDYRKEKNRIVWDARYMSGEIPHIDEQLRNASKNLMKSSGLLLLCVFSSFVLFYIGYLLMLP